MYVICAYTCVYMYYITSISLTYSFVYIIVVVVFYFILYISDSFSLLSFSLA